MRNSLLLAMACAAVTLAGCAEDPEIADTYDPDTVAAVAESLPAHVGSALGVVLTGENIVALLDTMYAASETAARLAQQKAQSADVRNFAELAAARHRAAREALALAAREYSISPVLPAEEEIGEWREAWDELQRASGAEFDRVYVTNALEIHEGLLDELDDARNEAGNRNMLQFLDSQREKLLTEIQALRALTN